MRKEIITDTNKIATSGKFKGLMLEMLGGYPEYEYFGKFESVFPNTGKKIVEILDKDKLIELSPIEEGEVKRYRLTPAGINLAISLTNLDYSKKMNKFTLAIIIIGAFTLLLGLNQLIFQFLR